MQNNRERALQGAMFEDALKREFFAGVADGFFVDVGAHHPTFKSQSLMFEQMGWRGLLIEPLSENVERLQRERTSPVEAVACGAPEHHDTKVQMKMGERDSWNTLADSMVDPAMAVRAQREVRVVTLDSLLEEHGAPTPLDFISIDVEGFELSVLRGFNLKRYWPRLILIEDHLNSLDVHRHMLRSGFRLLRRTKLNSWYVPAESEHRPTWRDAMKNFRAYHPLRVWLRSRKMQRRAALGNR